LQHKTTCQAVPFDKDLTTPNESKGFIGEHYDGDAGLQYLNARHYDPKLGMFIQPDWWEVTKAEVEVARNFYRLVEIGAKVGLVAPERADYMQNT
jgi:RHS repeat-associated protein